jgi:hypothetical protein
MSSLSFSRQGVLPLLEPPPHATKLVLPPDYFSPGTSIMNGKAVGSMWAEAYFNRTGYLFTRTELGGVWRLRIIIEYTDHEQDADYPRE